MLEQQALDRVHRLGQVNDVISTRYIVPGADSVEEVCTPNPGDDPQVNAGNSTYYNDNS
jgi:hypothetical protein